MSNFELMGRVNWSEIKYNDNGKAFARALIGEKKSNKEGYNTFPVTIFNTSKRNAAEDFVNTIKKGDYVKVTGMLNMNTWTDKVSNKEVSKLELIAFNFTPMVFDESVGKFVEKHVENCVDNEKFSTTEKPAEVKAPVVDEEVPF